MLQVDTPFLTLVFSCGSLHEHQASACMEIPCRHF